jgi:hypothetical protein
MRHALQRTELHPQVDQDEEDETLPLGALAVAKILYQSYRQCEDACRVSAL